MSSFMDDPLPCPWLRDTGHEGHAAEVVEEDGGEPDRILHVIVHAEPAIGFGAETFRGVEMNLSSMNF